MLNSSRLALVVVQFTTITWIVCTAFVALSPGFAGRMSNLAFHMMQATGLADPRLTVGGFVLGLIFWDIIAYLAAVLFAWLWNRSVEPKA